MSYQQEREQFIVTMAREGLHLAIARQLLRGATTMQRYAELSCSSVAADRDRVMCPGAKSHHDVECVCDYGAAGDPVMHQDVPRMAVLDQRLKWRLAKVLPAGWAIHTHGDPRGYVLRVIPPSYAERNRGRDVHNVDTIGVPSGPTRVRF